MPVPAQIRLEARHDHHMAEARPDLLLAAGAQIGLPGLKRLDPADLHVVGVVVVVPCRTGGGEWHLLRLPVECQ